MSRRLRFVRLAALAAALSFGLAASAAEPPRIALVQPERPDAILREAVTRLQAELTAAGFTVVLVHAAPDADLLAAVERAATGLHPLATVAVTRTLGGAAADIWVADHVTHKTVVRHVDTPATAEASLPAALAIRAVDLLRASLREASSPAAPSPAPELARPPAAPAPEPRALLERLTVLIGFAALYGLGENGGRVTPAIHLGYGTSFGLAGRLVILGPTPTDQLAMVELAYGFGRSFQTVAPLVSLGAGVGHTTFGYASSFPGELLTRATYALFGGSAGLAARLADRTAFVLEGRGLLALPGGSSTINHGAAAGKPQLLLAASLGFMPGF
jgi:hypothetical protein